MLHELHAVVIGSRPPRLECRDTENRPSRGPKLAAAQVRGRHGIPVEFIGMIATCASSETRPAEGPLVDVPFMRALARVHEESDFDRVLIGYYSDAPDGFVIASDVFAHTGRLGVLLAHRPGFVAPTVTARKLASLDRAWRGGTARGPGFAGLADYRPIDTTPTDAWVARLPGLRLSSASTIER
jgi:hypothetical protein